MRISSCKICISHGRVDEGLEHLNLFPFRNDIQLITTSKLTLQMQPYNDFRDHSVSVDIQSF